MSGLFPNTLHVARREYLVRVRGRAFVITTALLAIAVVALTLLPTILAIGKIATMVGLLGTVISMINTFNAIQAEVGKGGSVTAHVGAVGLALFATALGLVTAIPLVFAHVQFKAWIADFELKMKSAAQKLLIMMQSVKK